MEPPEEESGEHISGEIAEGVEGSGSEPASASLVSLAPVPYTNHIHDPVPIIDRVNDPVLADAYPPEIAFTLQLLDSAWPRLRGESLELRIDTRGNAGGKRLELSCGAIGDDDSVISHAAYRL